MHECNFHLQAKGGFQLMHGDGGWSHFTRLNCGVKRQWQVHFAILIISASLFLIVTYVHIHITRPRARD